MRDKSFNLDKLFNPKSVAVIGASNVPGKWGFSIGLNILTSGYSGKLFFVNPSENKVLGLKSYPHLKDITEEIEVAVITIPASFVPNILKECGEKRIPFVVLISSGFSETGEEGNRLEKKVVEIAKEQNIRIVGPNTMGYYSQVSKISAMGSPIRPLPGNIAFVSQSGNLGVQIMGRCEREGIGFCHFVGSGNEADLTVVDFLKYFGEDQNTKIILFYLESIKEGRRFYELAKKISKSKPIIVLKSAKTKSGIQAATSHTGALTMKNEVVESVFRNAGIIETDTTEEIIDLLLAFEHLPIPKSKKVGIMTMGGGWGVITAENCDKEGLNLPPLSKEAIDELDKLLPPFWNKNNPIDLVGILRRGTHFKAMEILAREENIDSIIAMGLLTGKIFSLRNVLEGIAISTINFYRNFPLAALSFLPTFIRGMRKARKQAKKNEFKKTGASGGFNPKEIREWRDEVVAQKINSLLKEYQKPIVVVSSSQGRELELAKKYHLVNYSSPERAAKVISKMAKYGEYKYKKEEQNETFLTPTVDKKEIKKIIQDKKVLTERESKNLLKLYNIPTVEEIIVTDIKEAKEAIKKMGYPVVLKIDSPDILHKTESGAVKLNIKEEEELKNAYNEILNNVKKYNPSAQINGILVQKMQTGIETIIGINYDEQFGAVILFGLGGIWTEVLNDVSFRLPPLTLSSAEEMIKEIKGYKILAGYRGKPKSDISSLAQILSQVSSLILDLKENIKEMDLNPVIVGEEGKGAKVIDALIVLK